MSKLFAFFKNWFSSQPKGRLASRTGDSSIEELYQIEKCASLKELAGGIAHEINNPLAIIMGRAQLIKIRSKKNSLDPDFLVDSMSKVEEASQRISSIVNALRLITKDSLKEPLTTVEIGRLIENVNTFWGARLKNHEVDFDVKVTCPDYKLRCREAQLTTVLLNLLSNAFHAARSARNEYKNQAWIKIEVTDTPEGLTIAVSDSGAGVPLALRERIFDPFFTTRDVGDGSGLGLTVSRSIAQDHGGDLTIDDKSQHTKFILTIPQAVAKKTAA